MAAHGIESSPLPDGAEVPEFTGPWAGDFERAYRLSTSELQRTVLSDGQVTEQENLALQDAFRSCLEARQFTEIEFEDNGGFTVRPPDGDDMDATNAVVTACQDVELGEASALYFHIQRNPGNANEPEIMVACLARQGLTPPGYTVDDYLRDSPAGSLPFDTDDIKFSECNADPLGAGQ